MTTTYRTPEWLGNLEVRLAGGCTAGCGDTVEVAPMNAPDGFVMTVNWQELTKVEPPLPPEPKDQGWYVATYDDGFAEPLERRNDGWFVWRTTSLHGSWESVCADHTPVVVARLILGPESTDLPWSLVVDEQTTRKNSRTDIRLSAEGIHDVNRAVGDYAVGVVMSPEQARAKGHTLLSAADQWEEVNRVF